MYSNTKEIFYITMYGTCDIDHKLTTAFAFFVKAHVTASSMTASD